LAKRTIDEETDSPLLAENRNFTRFVMAPRSVAYFTPLEEGAGSRCNGYQATAIKQPPSSKGRASG
jgi:hypothetical protein